MRKMRRVYFLLSLLGLIMIGKGQSLYLPGGSTGIGNNTTNFNVGVGTSIPAFQLHLKNPSGGAALGLERNGKLWRFDLDYAEASKLYVGYSTVSNVLVLTREGNIGVGTDAPFGKLHIETNSHHPSLLTFKNTLYSPYQVYHFQLESDGLKIKQDNSINYQFKSGGDFIVDNGSIRSREVNVSLTPGSGPDYVFEKGYDLPSLEEVQTYITENKHLPEIPSAKEMEANGINLSEMNMLLLKKIEELTLYILQQEQRIKDLELKSK